MKIPTNTAIVVGATGSIGSAVAEYCAAKFDRTLLLGRSPAKLRAIRDAAQNASPDKTIVAAKVDLGDPLTLAQLISDEQASFVAVCTGIVAFGTSRIPAADLRAMLDTNFVGVIDCVQAAVAQMRQSQLPGLIVPVASMSVRRQRPLRGGYAATQGALFGYCRSLRKELAEEPIRVSLLCPGFVETPMAQQDAPTISADAMIPLADLVKVLDLLVELPVEVDVPEVFVDCAAQLAYPS